MDAKTIVAAALAPVLRSIEDTPFVWRRTIDKQSYEVRRADNTDWRDAVSDEATTWRFAFADEAKAECERLRNEWRSARLADAVLSALREHGMLREIEERVPDAMPPNEVAVAMNCMQRQAVMYLPADGSSVRGAPWHRASRLQHMVAHGIVGKEMVRHPTHKSQVKALWWLTPYGLAVREAIVALPPPQPPPDNLEGRDP